MPDTVLAGTQVQDTLKRSEDGQHVQLASSPERVATTQLPERLRSTEKPDSLESLKLLVAGGFAGAVSKTATAPLARLTILYQVSLRGFHLGALRSYVLVLWTMQEQLELLIELL